MNCLILLVYIQYIFLCLSQSTPSNTVNDSIIRQQIQCNYGIIKSNNFYQTYIMDECYNRDPLNAIEFTCNDNNAIDVKIFDSEDSESCSDEHINETLPAVNITQQECDAGKVGKQCSFVFMNRYKPHSECTGPYHHTIERIAMIIDTCIEYNDGSITSAFRNIYDEEYRQLVQLHYPSLYDCAYDKQAMDVPGTRTIAQSVLIFHDDQCVSFDNDYWYIQLEEPRYASDTDEPTQAPQAGFEIATTEPTQSPSMVIEVESTSKPSTTTAPITNMKARDFKCTLDGDYDELLTIYNDTDELLDWATNIVNILIKKDLFTELNEIIIEIIDVIKGSIVIEYELIAWSDKIIDIAEKNANEFVLEEIHVNNATYQVNEVVEVQKEVEIVTSSPLPAPAEHIIDNRTIVKQPYHKETYRSIFGENGPTALGWDILIVAIIILFGCCLCCVCLCWCGWLKGCTDFYWNVMCWFNNTPLQQNGTSDHEMELAALSEHVYDIDTI